MNNTALTFTLVPAYGRDYKSKSEVQAALDADKDFTYLCFASSWDGKPVNKSQLVANGAVAAKVRYSNLRKVAVFNLIKE